MRKFGILFIAVCIAFLAACSNGKSSNNAQSPTTSAATVAPATSTANNPAPAESAKIPEASAAACDPLGKFTAPVKVSTYSIPSPNLLKNETIDDNIFTQLNNQYLNINYVNKWTVDQSQLNQKLNIGVASNDLPDVFEVDDQQTLQKMIDAGETADLTDVYNNCASADLKKILEYDNKVNFPGVTVGGKLMAIPLPSTGYAGVPMMYIRTDWLKKLNLQVPKTMDELLNVARAFVNDDPDGDNKKDTYAMYLSKTLGDSINGIANGAHAYPSLWVEKDGNLVYGSIQPEMKTALGYLNQIYAMGGINPQFAVMDDTAADSAFEQGKTGIYFGVFWRPISPLVQVRKNVTTAEWDVYPIPGDNVVPENTPFSSRWLVVRKGFDHPEAAIKSLNLYVNRDQYPEYEKAAQAYQDLNLQIQVNAKPAIVNDPDQNVITSDQIIQYLKTKDPSVVTYAPAQSVLSNMQKGEDTDGYWYYNKIFGPDGSMKVYESYNGNFMHNEFNGVPTPSMVSKLTTLNTLEEQTIVKIIMGQQPLDSFDSFVSQWTKLVDPRLPKK